ncbi:hypothetical protein NGA_0024302 [Nannochloropsis gaditana CCMP526]|uniref:uncharacterized protein n=1 Tax=Nannochloropsis gaditana (strain CCMP526) TaxID=1093141 RepID=UPI00029F6669|nr:hypothetical protein NGA_0024302 [Nannochloropsis gaditana CCMP526]EKU22120.1 hypothetical protein NGA_0024302 [Nannochloropsis gaditana CCMP526]|eukprot:XP_005854240.1 hypothetical protein NGA_0024302 [Nannochloropsis gaditana CCMP526]
MATLRFLALLFSCFYFCVRCQGQRFSDLKNMAANQKGGIVTVGNEFKDQAGEKFKERTEEVKSSLQGLFDPVGSPGKSAFFQKVKKDGIDSVELFETLFKSKAFESILENVEIQHRIIEGVPILGAVSGFREARGRRLTDQETTAGFSKGVRNLLEMFKTSAKHALVI